jgi:Mor family transcriptional regulator
MVKAAPLKTETPPTADLLSQPAPLPVVDLGAVQLPDIDLTKIPHSDDLVEYTLRIVLALAPALSDAIKEDMKSRASKQIREIYGGKKVFYGDEQVYIGKRPTEGRFARNAQIRRDYKAGERIHLLERRYGLSARRLWQIISE